MSFFATNINTSGLISDKISSSDASDLSFDFKPVKITRPDPVITQFDEKTSQFNSPSKGSLFGSPSSKFDSPSSKGSKGSKGSLFSRGSILDSPSSREGSREGSREWSRGSKKFDNDIAPPSPNNRMLMSLKSNGNVKEKFINYALKKQNEENEKFIFSVIDYKKDFPNKSETANKNICTRMVNIFIVEKSSFEINISYDLKMKILNNAKNPSIDIFDEAFDEIVNILANGIWKEFVKEEMETPESFVRRMRAKFNGSTSFIRKSIYE